MVARSRSRGAVFEGSLVAMRQLWSGRGRDREVVNGVVAEMGVVQRFKVQNSKRPRFTLASLLGLRPQVTFTFTSLFVLP
jgi:hypothetical protein